MSLEVNASNFQSEVLDSPVPVLVDFWAEWCGPCRVMGPILEEIAGELEASKIKIAKVNVDQAGELAQQYEIMSIPAFKLFKGGKVVAEFVGSRSKQGVIDVIKDHI